MVGRATGPYASQYSDSKGPSGHCHGWWKRPALRAALACASVAARERVPTIARWDFAGLLLRNLLQVTIIWICGK